MFAWKLILALALSYQGAQKTPIPAEYLPANSPPITIQFVSGTEIDDFAQAGRVLGDTYEETLECRISLNRDSKVFVNRREVGYNAQGMAMLRYLKDGTTANDRPKLFLLSHEIGHCFDNEKMPNGIGETEGYRVWKEGYADAFAVLTIKQQGAPEAQLESLAVFREIRADKPYGEQWAAMLRQAANSDVVGKSDADLLKMASEIRRNVWKQS